MIEWYFSSGSTTGSGSLAQTTSSMLEGLWNWLLFPKKSSKWQWGRERFWYSIVRNRPVEGPKIPFLLYCIDRYLSFISGKVHTKPVRVPVLLLMEIAALACACGLTTRPRISRNESPLSPRIRRTKSALSFSCCIVPSQGSYTSSERHHVSISEPHSSRRVTLKFDWLLEGPWLVLYRSRWSVIHN